MADKQESGMQIVTRSIELANGAMESGRQFLSCGSTAYRISSLRKLVDCLSSVSKSVFEHDNGRYLTNTLFTFLSQRPPRQPRLFPLSDNFPEDLAWREITISQFQVSRLLGLLGLILLHDTCMSLPPLPLHEFYPRERLDDVATLLYYLDIWDQDLVRLLLNLLVQGTIYDKFISVMALGAIAQQSGEVNHSVEAGVMGVFSEILKQGPMILQAEVAHVISKFVAIDRTIHDKLPLYDVIGSLVSHIQFMAAEENFQDDINTTTASAFSMAAASRTLNSWKIADGRKEESPEVKARMVATVNKTLRILVKNDSSLCWTIIEGLKDVAFSLRCLGIDEVILTMDGRAQVLLLLSTLKGGSLYDKWISVMALGAIAQQPGDVERLVEAGVVVVFTKILKEGPMLLQAEVAHVMSKCVAIDPTFWDKLPLHDLVVSLVSCLQFMADEDHFQHDINTTASAFSIRAASRTSNSSKIEDERKENSPEVKARMVATVNKTLRVLVKDDSSLCWTIIEGLKDVAFSLHCLGIEEAILTMDGRAQVPLLLSTLRGGSLYDKWISVMALGAIAQQPGYVERLVEAGVVVVFTKILKEGPMLLQAEVAHVMSKCVAIDPAFRDKLPLHDLVVSLVSCLQFMADEDHFQHDINTTASAFSIRAASRTSNSSKIADGRKENSPEVKARMVATVNKTLRILVKDDSSLCWTIIEGLKDVACSLRCLGIDEAILTTEGRAQVPLLLNTLRGGSLYDKCISVMALGAIAQQPGDVERLVEAGVGVVFAETLNQGPMLLQAEVANVISKFVEMDSTIQDKLPLHDLVVSLVSHLRFKADEDYFQKNMTTLVLSKGAASHNSNSMKIVDDGNENSPEAKARTIATVAKTLLILVKNDPSLCWTVVEVSKDVAFSLRCLGIDEEILTTEGRAQVSLLLNFFRGSSLYYRWISLVALGVIAQETRKVEHLVAAGVVVVFSKILKEGPMQLQAEVAHVISICLKIDPTFCDQLPLDDLITSFVSLLQVEVAEEHLQDDINKATSVLSIVAARHNSNKRKVAAERNEKSMSGEVNQPQHEVSPQVKGRMSATAAKALGALAKDNAPACHIIVEKRAILCLAVLLQNERLDVKLSSVMALMEITAVAEKESDLRRSGFKHSSYAHKTVVDQLMRIISQALDVKSGMHRDVTAELLIPCIKAIGNLAATFRVTQPIIPLVHLLGSSNYRGSINDEVIKETLAALSKFACRDHSFLHLDHSKAIVSLGGLYRILLLAAHEDIGVEKHALVLLCYVGVDALGNESDELKKVVSAINLASRKGHFSKDEAVKALLQQTKRRLGQLILA